MLGIYYLILCILVGHIISSLAFPKLKTFSNKTYKGRNIGAPREFLLFPSYFVMGTILVTWTTYIIAYMSRSLSSPLTLANGLVISFYTVLCVLYYGKVCFEDRKDDNPGGVTKGELVFLFLIILLSIFLMWFTFYIIDDVAHVGFTVFSDFSPHIGMVRSFSKGNNFPTQYTFFAGEDIRYHFMFFFLIGNLEFLGLRLDFAFNIPSVLGLISTYLLLYVLAVKISGKRKVGYLTALFFTFRSSPSLFKYLAQIANDSNVFEALSSKTDYIGFTPKEDWGLWNLNVYCNQRHFAFSLAVLLLLLIMFLPRLYKMFSSIKDLKRDKKIKNIFFTKEAWLVKDYKTAIFAGILAGSTAFWNGASLIALISILFIMTIFSANRLEYLITALIATGLSLLQSAFFVKGSPVSPQIYFGFIVENPNVFSVIQYLISLFGVLLLVLLVSFVLKTGIDRYIMIAFLGPAIITFAVSLTPDVTVNHKYLMITVMLLGIYAADFVVYIFGKKDVLYKGIGVILIILMTSTGLYDFTTLVRSNKRTVNLELNHEITNWIEDNSSSQDIFLTAPYALNQVVLGGPSLYQGWTYFAWSAGYDTHSRNQQVNLMYEGESPRDLDDLIKENNIRYIIVDKDNRVSEDYNLNEYNIMNTYEKVFEYGSGQDKLSIYDCTLLKNDLEY